MMINGEGAGAEEEVSSAIYTPCVLLFDRESDCGGDELSHYSSCGESEFDKYCSASSAMGTPSFRCGSYPDSDIGSLKSFKLGGENTTFRNFGENKKLSGFGEFESGESSDIRKENGMPDFNARTAGYSVKDINLAENLKFCSGEKSINGQIGEDIIQVSEEKFREMEGDEGCYEGDERTDQCEKFEALEDGCGNLSDEDYASSRHDHSDGEVSMFGCGSDDDDKIYSYNSKIISSHEEKCSRNENVLVMNSKVAFGYDDWDDFIQEKGGNNFNSLSWDAPLEEKQCYDQSGADNCGLLAVEVDKHSGVNLAALENEVIHSFGDCDQAQSTSRLTETVSNLSTDSPSHMKHGTQLESEKELLVERNLVNSIKGSADHLQLHYVSRALKLNENWPTLDVQENEKLNINQAESELKIIKTNKLSSDSSMETGLGKINTVLDPFSGYKVSHRGLVQVKDIEDKRPKLFGDEDPATTTVATGNEFSTVLSDPINNHFDPKKGLKLNDFYCEVVDDMEDILFDSGDTPGSSYSRYSRTYQPQFSRPSRDGGSSASTSGTDHAQNWSRQPPKIDRVEVASARQVDGDVSFSERIVGVKKYTVYRIRVWSGENHWEVERRYREFNALYSKIKKLFVVQDVELPSPWSLVNRESRKLFGNASPDTIADRSVLIQECLQSIIDHEFPSSILVAISCFLAPSDLSTDSLPYNTNAPITQFPNKNTLEENFSTLGKTISFNVHIFPFKSMKQMLDVQHYRCAGCHKSFDDGKSMMQEYFKALVGGKPRLCEYSGQLFCSLCHSNDTAVLPAKVLHNWDFTRYPISHMAKSYLESIYDQPMLCLSAINPFLFSKVPALQHVANIRNKIRAMLPYVRCSFRGSIDKGLGSRDYLLASNDFFSLKDLVDLSKGIFSTLPVMLDTVSRKIQEHIIEQCLVCYDVGIPCNARQICNNPLSLIFPFQEDEVKKCSYCKLVFHEKCFKTMANCPCGARFKQEDRKQSADAETEESSNGFFSDLFSKVTPWISPNGRKRDLEDADNVILMGSLSRSSL